jgi:hypothetical protein
LHNDYSPGNILYKRCEDGRFDFSIIDINRMKFCEVNYRMGCNNFRRLCADDLFFKVVAQTYAQEMGYVPTRCIRDILRYKEIELKKRETKNRFLGIFKKK